MPALTEADRIRHEYARRARRIPADFYALTRPANLFAEQQKTHRLLQLLRNEALLPLERLEILDVGCGDGWQLLQFEHWGARPEKLAGIDLIQSRVNHACARFAGCGPGAGPRLQVGDASNLPWPSASFDVTYQGTVFSSVLDSGMKRAMAREIVRVLRPGGTLIWYDFLFDNPANQAVRGIGAHEIRALFPDCSVRLKRITLAPPVARRLVPITWIGSALLERMTLLNTHYLGVIRKPS